MRGKHVKCDTKFIELVSERRRYRSYKLGVTRLKVIELRSMTEQITSNLLSERRFSGMKTTSLGLFKLQTILLAKTSTRRGECRDRSLLR